MDEKPTQDLATRAFQKRVLDEFAAVHAEQAELRKDLGEARKDFGDLRKSVEQMRDDLSPVQTQQAAMARSIAGVDQRLASLEQRVDERLRETRPIWEAVQVQIQRLSEKLDGILLDFYELRNELKIHGRRIGELERRILP